MSDPALWSFLPVSSLKCCAFWGSPRLSSRSLYSLGGFHLPPGLQLLTAPKPVCSRPISVLSFMLLDPTAHGGLLGAPTAVSHTPLGPTWQNTVSSSPAGQHRNPGATLHSCLDPPPSLIMTNSYRFLSLTSGPVTQLYCPSLAQLSPRLITPSSQSLNSSPCIHPSLPLRATELLSAAPLLGPPEPS